MTKFLIAILLIIVALKLIVDDALVYKYNTVNYAVHDEEDKNDKNDFEKGEKDKEKKDNEDKFYNYYIIRHASFNPAIVQLASLRFKLPDSGFGDKPYTPPDAL